MAEQIGATQPPVSFDYELYEGDPDRLRTVVVTSPRVKPQINPALLKLKHRIGRGPFGDVWLATHHQTADDFDEYHEVAVKMLHPVKEDQISKLLNKLNELFSKLRELPGVCWLHGISVISGKICIAMKFYEGSVGDRMAQLKGGKLPLSDVLRYGIGLAKAVQGLHSLGELVLNLKPSNFLLDEHDHVFLGDIGIPYLLLGVQLPNADFALRSGTPSYMAPEQWEPEVRGPITFETDSWSFGCSIVEMISGSQPWFGKSIQEIYQLVVTKQERPQFPSGLPPAVENVLYGCFEYDLRNRPLMSDIIEAFESTLNSIQNDEEWVGIGNRISVDKSSGYSSWFLSKDHLQVGDTVRSRKAPNSCKLKPMDVPEGMVVGLEKDTDRDGFVFVRIHGMHNPQKVNISTLQRVTSGLVSGDWVRLIEENEKHSPVGILHNIKRDGAVSVGFVGLETLWRGHCSRLQMVEPICVGQFVRLKENVFAPRFEWPSKSEGKWATGKISQILPNGSLVVKFPGKFQIGNEISSFYADPAQVELISFNNCLGIVEKYQHVEDFHWAVRPLAIALSLFTALKLGFFVGHSVGIKLKKRKKNQGQGESCSQEGQSGNNSAWIPNILFRDGASTATAR